MSTKSIRALRLIVVGAALSCIVGVTRAQLTLATGDDAEISEDGLHRVDREQIVGAWAKPGLDLSRYTRIYYQPTGVVFRDVDAVATDLLDSRSDEIYAVPATRQAQLRQQFAEALLEAIGEIDRFELTTDIGRDVLLVRGNLLDFISAVPPESSGSRTTEIRWAYEATLLIELRDAMSDEILARSIERQRANGPIDVNDITILTPRLFRSWAGQLARDVQQFGELAR